jgi:DNA repair exonuclease SbcCD ATPase subunit
MRIHFKRVRYKNILSTGNAFTIINLDEDPTTLVSGSNGSGKSTLLDALVFGLYGKPFRKINKPQLLNTINNRELVVEIEFTAGGSEYFIRRGIKPNIFEIHKDGKLINQDSASRDYQSYLEQNVLGINYKAFNQIIVLGSATYVPFMELPAHSRREIIEDLLDIQVFSTMGLLAKDRLNDNKSHLYDVDNKIEIAESNVLLTEQNNDEIRKIKEVEVNKIKEKMTKHIEDIEEKNKMIDTQDEIIKVLYDDISDKSSEQKKLQYAMDKRAELSRNRLAFEKELAFYNDHDNCPTCKQGIAHDFKKEQINEKNQQREDIESALEASTEVIKRHQDRLESISKIEEQIQEVNFKISEHRAEIKMSKNALKAYKSELENAEREVEEIDLSTLEKFQTILKERQCEKKTLLHQQGVLNIVSTILKDGGIKAKIISQYIPVINKLINKYLAAFDLFVDFQLDETFNEIIKSRFRDTFSYASFSEGEKLRITLSIMLAWRSVAKLRNSVSTNLLILDETLDGALDGVGIEHLIETLHNLNTDDNIFVISHRGDQFAEKFAGHIKFSKVKNFSEIAA